MSHIRHLPSASMSNGRASLKYQTGESLKRANRLSSDFFFLLSSVSVLSARLADNSWSYYNDSNTKKQHKSPRIALTTSCYCRTWTIHQQFPSTPMLMLSAIRHFARIVLFIELLCSAEHVFRAYRVVSFPDHIFHTHQGHLLWKMNLGWQQSKSGI